MRTAGVGGALYAGAHQNQKVSKQDSRFVKKNQHLSQLLQSNTQSAKTYPGGGGGPPQNNQPAGSARKSPIKRQPKKGQSEEIVISDKEINWEDSNHSQQSLREKKITGQQHVESKLSQREEGQLHQSNLESSKMKFTMQGVASSSSGQFSHLNSQPKIINQDTFSSKFHIQSLATKQSGKSVKKLSQELSDEKEDENSDDSEAQNVKRRIMIQQQETEAARQRQKEMRANELKRQVTSIVQKKNQKHILVLKKSVVYLFHGKVKIYGLRSLWIFHGENPIRMAAVWLVEWKYFDYGIMFVIFLNSLSLAMYDYNDRDSLTAKNQFLDHCGDIFTFVFAAEGALEILARGFILHNRSYMRDGWCILDFFVIVSGILEFSMNSIKLKALRSLRALRPLRSITAIPSMRKLVSALIQSMPDFLNVTIFLIFVFSLFAILGMHQYNGQLYNACRFQPSPESPGESWLIDTSITRICSRTGNGNFHCPEDSFCGNPADFGIPLDTEDAINRGYMYYGIHNFDNFASSMQVVFQLVTTENWSNYMYNLMDVDSALFAAFYSITIVVIGSFFLMNLVLAVIIQAFITITRKELEEDINKLERDEKDQRKQGDLDPEVTTAQILEYIKLEELSLDQSQMQQIDRKKREVPKTRNSDAPLFIKNKTYFLEKSMKKSFGAGEITEKVLFEENEEEPAKQEEVGRKETYKDQSLDHEEGIASSLKIKASLTRKDKEKEIEQDEFQRDVSKEKIVISAFMNNEGDSSIQDQKKKQSLDAFTFGEELKQKTRELPQIIVEKSVSVFPPSPSQDQSGKYQQNEKPSEQKPQSQSLKLMLPGLNLQAKPQQAEPQMDSKVNPFAFAMANIGKLKEINQKEISPLNQAMMQYLDKMKRKEFLRNQLMSKMLIQTKEKFEETKRQAKVKNSLRSIASIKVRLELKKGFFEADTIQHQLAFRLEYRSQQNCLYRIAYKVIKSPFFQFLILSMIIINTVVLAMDKYPIESNYNQTLDTLNYVFSGFFMLEMVIKLFGLGFYGYFIDPYNIFDCIIVVASTIDIIVSVLVQRQSGSVATAIRGFRLMRLFKLAKQWRRLSHLLTTVVRTLKDVATFSILLFLFMFTFALLGMETYANRVKFSTDDRIDQENGSSPDSNFDTLINAFATVFVVLTADGWSAIYFNHYRGVQNGWSTAYFILLIIIGQRVLLNLFLAILLQNFDENNLREKIEEQLENSIRAYMKPMKERIKHIMDKIGEYFKRITRSKQAIQNSQQMGQKDTAPRDSSQAEMLNNSSIEESIEIVEDEKGLETQRREGGKTDNPHVVRIRGNSLNLFSKDNPCRLLIINIVNTKRFEQIILICIIISSIQLALDGANDDPESKKQTNLFFVDVIMTSIFLFEAALKIIGYGFIANGRPSYMRNPWNILDFIIVLFSLISLTPIVDGLRVFKMFRILRILRLISRNKNLRVGMQALLYAIPNMFNVTIIMLFFFLIFGILLVSFFKGKFFSCQTDHLSALIDSIAHKWDCLSAGGNWMNNPDSFDNIFTAMRALSIMATAAAWADMMYLLVSATDIDQVPVKMNNPFWIFFCIFFIIVASFFLINLFVGVVISTFNSEQDKLGKNDLLTDKQKEWIDARLLILRSTPEPKLKSPSNPLRKVFFKVYMHSYFEPIILGSIILNTLVLALKWYMQPEGVTQATEIINYIFTAIFTSEAVIKLMAMGVNEYCKNPWNIFDFFIIIGSLGSILLYFYLDVPVKGAITIVRSFRILRVIRLIRRAKSLNLIFNTFVITMPALINIGGLLLLVIYLYAIVGVQLLGQVKHNSIISQNLNFENFANAFCALCAIATADSWGTIMQAEIQTKKIVFDCVQDPTYDDYVEAGYQTVGCGPGKLGVFYFFSFYVFVNLIFLNLFIAIVLQGFSDTQTKDQRLFNFDMLKHFQDIWGEFDPDATSFIPLHTLRIFLRALGKPLGFNQEELDNKFLQDKFIAALQLPTYDNFSKYQFVDVLEALSLRLMVMDHTQKYKLSRKATKGASGLRESGGEANNEQEDVMNTEEQQEEMKAIINEDIGKLMIHREADQIMAIKEVKAQEVKLESLLNVVKKDEELTSMHHAAAEVAINRMKKFLYLKRKFKDRLASKEAHVKGPPRIFASAPQLLAHEDQLLQQHSARQRKISDIEEEEAESVKQGEDNFQSANPSNEEFNNQIEPDPEYFNRDIDEASARINIIENQEDRGGGAEGALTLNSDKDMEACGPGEKLIDADCEPDRRIESEESKHDGLVKKRSSSKLSSKSGQSDAKQESFQIMLNSQLMQEELPVKSEILFDRTQLPQASKYPNLQQSSSSNVLLSAAGGQNKRIPIQPLMPQMDSPLLQGNPRSQSNPRQVLAPPPNNIQYQRKVPVRIGAATGGGRGSSQEEIQQRGSMGGTGDNLIPNPYEDDSNQASTGRGVLVQRRSPPAPMSRFNRFVSGLKPFEGVEQLITQTFNKTMKGRLRDKQVKKRLEENENNHTNFDDQIDFFQPPSFHQPG